MLDIDILDALCAWELYCTFKKDLEMVFYLYDDASRGKLNEAQVKRMLQEICGVSLTRDEMLNILNEELHMEESISRYDFAAMVVRWYASAAGKSVRQEIDSFVNRASCIKTCFPIPACDTGAGWCPCSAVHLNNIMVALAAGATGKLQQGNQKVQESEKLRRQWLV